MSENKIDVINLIKWVLRREIWLILEVVFFSSEILFGKWNMHEILFNLYVNFFMLKKKRKKKTLKDFQKMSTLWYDMEGSAGYFWGWRGQLGNKNRWTYDLVIINECMFVGIYISMHLYVYMYVYARMYGYIYMMYLRICSLWW